MAGDEFAERRAVAIDAKRIRQRQRDLAAGRVCRRGRAWNAACAAGGSNR